MTLVIVNRLRSIAVQQLEQHHRVLFRHLLRCILTFALLPARVRQLGPSRHLLDALDLLFTVLYFSLEGKYVARLVAPFDLRVVLRLVEETSVAFRVAGSRCLPLWVEQGVWVALGVACYLDCGHVC